MLDISTNLLVTTTNFPLNLKDPSKYYQKIVKAFDKEYFIKNKIFGYSGLNLRTLENFWISTYDLNMLRYGTRKNNKIEL